MCAPAAVMPPLAALVPIGHEWRADLLVCDPLSIGREAARERARHRKHLRQAAIERDAPEAQIRLLRRTRPRRGEEHVLAVGRPAADTVLARVKREALWIATSGRHDVHVGIAAQR